jgi:hypothetical protein
MYILKSEFPKARPSDPSHCKKRTGGISSTPRNHHSYSLFFLPWGESLSRPPPPPRRVSPRGGGEDRKCFGKGRRMPRGSFNLLIILPRRSPPPYACPQTERRLCFCLSLILFRVSTGGGVISGRKSFVIRSKSRSNQHPSIIHHQQDDHKTPLSPRIAHGIFKSRSVSLRLRNGKSCSKSCVRNPSPPGLPPVWEPNAHRRSDGAAAGRGQADYRIRLADRSVLHQTGQDRGVFTAPLSFFGFI